MKKNIEICTKALVKVNYNTYQLIILKNIEIKTKFIEIGGKKDTSCGVFPAPPPLTSDRHA